MSEFQKSLKAIERLLVDCDDTHWLYVFTCLNRECELDAESTKLQVLGLYGGMGSFNDLVLYRDGHVLTAENDELDSLRSQLFLLCRS